MKQKKNSKKTKIALISLSLAWLVSVASVATYSWIARNWTPKVEYTDISIATSGALVISIDDKTGDVYNEVNLNKFFGINSYTLKQVSSSNGRNFVGADFSPVISGGNPIYSEDVSGKYIELDFFLKAQPYEDPTITNTKQVYLHPETTIEYLPKVLEEGEEPTMTEEELASLTRKVETAVRFSIETKGSDPKTYIFCKDRTGLNNDETTDGKDLIYQGLNYHLVLSL